MQQTFHTVVEKDHEGVRLDVYLAQRLQRGDVPESLRGVSRSQIQQAIKRGSVRVNGAPVPARTTLQEGMRIDIEGAVGRPDDTPVLLAPEDRSLEVLFEDDDLLVINKPAGMVVHPGAGCKEGTLVHALLGRGKVWSSLGGPERPGIVHRLDKDTSGVMVVAKNNVTHAALGHMFAAREVQKTYVAFTLGEPRPLSGVWDTFFGRNPSSRIAFSSKVSDGRRAVTHYKTQVSWAGVSEVWVKPRTGRTHQIRVHMADAGCPIVGDGLYGGCAWGRIKDAVLRKTAQEGLAGQALHAWKLAFKHPKTGVLETFEAHMPAVLQALSAVLREHP
jgi:23S rRNA pseudouridine1911/1915/1917 synthase